MSTNAPIGGRNVAKKGNCTSSDPSQIWVETTKVGASCSALLRDVGAAAGAGSRLFGGQTSDQRYHLTLGLGIAGDVNHT